MKIGDGVEWAIHCCTVLAFVPPERALPAARLAEFHGVPAAYLAKHLQSLSRAGIVESIPGARGGYRLARPPDGVTLLDIVQAVEGDEPAFRCDEIRQRGPAALADRKAYAKPCTIATTMLRAEAAWRRELRATSLADIVNGLAGAVDPRASVKGARWMQEVLR